LLDVLNLADLGNTVLIIEHHMDVIKQADLIVDLDPKAAKRRPHRREGTPEQVSRVKKSYTGQILARVLNGANAITRTYSCGGGRRGEFRLVEDG